ncbi:hypothetical protein B0I29_126155 [Actinoplanes lutulentus]|uniref:Uncharacterized protein n=1 Tax=Actinoplanes lutulentus TaxID=1287878 RepID=A0A327Z047_9ACTN|nr:hypothetical protein B0I29_126155 [Actinoplanes lutulentus]
MAFSFRAGAGASGHHRACPGLTGLRAVTATDRAGLRTSSPPHLRAGATADRAGLRTAGAAGTNRTGLRTGTVRSGAGLSRSRDTRHARTCLSCFRSLRAAPGRSATRTADRARLAGPSPACSGAGGGAERSRGSRAHHSGSALDSRSGLDSGTALGCSGHGGAAPGRAGALCAAARYVAGAVVVVRPVVAFRAVRRARAAGPANHSRLTGRGRRGRTPVLAGLRRNSGRTTLDPSRTRALDHT